MEEKPAEDGKEPSGDEFQDASSADPALTNPQTGNKEEELCAVSGELNSGPDELAEKDSSDAVVVEYDSLIAESEVPIVQYDNLLSAPQDQVQIVKKFVICDIYLELFHVDLEFQLKEINTFN